MNSRRFLTPLLIVWLALLSFATQAHASSHILGEHDAVCEWCQQYDNLNAGLASASSPPLPTAQALQSDNSPIAAAPIRGVRRYAIRAPPSF
ncbi:DUF2946 family protein [uncultured Ferrimonas sp.]|uniref:DUF2946 family protein n=1 Tax=uncultured Ferrimonas sp. TaxID=432640 RepID=UPI0026051807|nr:DUF2946 family protein [uncultured Ferrimonas sp.]